MGKEPKTDPENYKLILRAIWSSPNAISSQPGDDAEQSQNGNSGHFSDIVANEQNPTAPKGSQSLSQVSFGTVQE